MTTKTIFMMLPILLVLLVTTTSTAYAHGGHHHEGKGGCSVCNPPTLGIDGSGKRLVSGGLSINENIFDVELFKQEINSQIVKTGEPVEITLKMYDTSGYDEIKHVEINLGRYDVSISGMLVEQHPVTIEWNKEFDGKTTEMVMDKDELIKDVSIQVLDNSPIVGIKFIFTPVEEFDASTIVTKIWDMKRNFNVNYFYNALEIVSDEPSVIATRIESVPVSLSEETHTELSATDRLVEEVNQDIQCNTGEIQMLRTSNNSPVCVSAYQASVLVQNNWARIAQ